MENVGVSSGGTALGQFPLLNKVAYDQSLCSCLEGKNFHKKYAFKKVIM